MDSSRRPRARCVVPIFISAQCVRNGSSVPWAVRSPGAQRGRPGVSDGGLDRAPQQKRRREPARIGRHARLAFEPVGEHLRVVDAPRQDERLPLHRKQLALRGRRGVRRREEGGNLDQCAPGMRRQVGLDLRRAPRRFGVGGARHRTGHRRQQRERRGDECDPVPPTGLRVSGLRWPQRGRRSHEWRGSSARRRRRLLVRQYQSNRHAHDAGEVGKRKRRPEAPFIGKRRYRGYASALIECTRRDFVREAEFLWMIFLSAMRSITACDA